ncbi:hypothetical protein SE91_27780 [Bradyrhizobium sp. DOA1]|nr:hypothetical protein SE91_27780 [Bradyrhizobium sp. DOA1]
MRHRIGIFAGMLFRVDMVSFKAHVAAIHAGILRPPLRRHGGQVGLYQISGRRTRGGKSLIEKAAEIGNGFAAPLKLLDCNDNLISIEDVQKCVDRPLAVARTRFQVVRQNGLGSRNGFQYLLLGRHRQLLHAT